MYGLKEKNLAKTYIKVIPLGRNDPDAIRLLNWKKPTERYVSHNLAIMTRICSLHIPFSRCQRTSGDFPTVLYEVVNKRSSVVEGTMTVTDINNMLDELAQNMGKS